MTNFTKYNSIENSYRERFTNQCLQLGVKEWVALEKIHGANFGFISEGGEVTPFKRSSILGADKNTGMYDFYGCNPIVEACLAPIQDLETELDQPIQVYGELYGQGVQKEVTYGPKAFLVFDILLLDDDIYMDWDDVVRLCRSVGLNTAPELARGSLEELLKISPERESIVAKEAGHSSMTEGHVIKQLRNDSFLPSGSRAILKVKSKAFSEKRDKVKTKQPQSIPEHLLEVVETFYQYLTRNRLLNVLSKFGTVTQKDFGKIQGLFVKDALEDFQKDGNMIEKDDWKKVSKIVGKAASQVIREDWLNIIDGNI